MATTRLGWDVFTTSSNKRLTNFPWITGKVRDGDAYTVLYELARRFNDNVEPIIRAHSWGWAYRAVRGASIVSEHAAGTAVDFNAPAHGLGRVGTFSRDEVAEIREILSYLEGSVRWGGDYAGRKDEMHFELQGGVKKLAAVAKKIVADRLGTASTPSKKQPSTPSAPANAYTTKRVTVDDAKVYANRGAKKRLVGEPSKGYRLNVVKVDGSWTQIRWKFDGKYQNAWIPSVHVKPEDTGGRGDDDPNTYKVRSEKSVRYILIRATSGTDKNSTPHLIGLYQRDQLAPFTLYHDQIFGPATDSHYRWVHRLQAEMNKWKGSKVELNGSYNKETKDRVLELQKRNRGGAYKGYPDGVPGPVFCSMLGVPNYPNK